jgi:putative FmdB family regulatory protein
VPTYQYVCTECDTPLEAVQSFTDDALTECPACGGKLRKVFSAVGVVFKGSGFYRTDSRSTSSAAVKDSSESGKSGSKDGAASNDKSGSADKASSSSSDKASSSDKGSSGSSGSSGSKDSGSSKPASSSSSTKPSGGSSSAA